MRTRTVALLAAATFTLAVVVTLVIGANLAHRPHLQSAPPSGPSTAPAVTPAASSSYNPDAGDAGEDDKAPPETQEALWAPAVDHFGRNFTNTTGGRQKWRQRLIGPTARPYVTTEVADQLDTVDTRNVPEGRYTGYELLKSSAYEIAVKIDYREGWALVVYLITDGRVWQVYAYDKWEE